MGGMVFSCFNTIPEDGSTPEVDIHGLHIQVEDITDHRLETALVSIISSAASSGEKDPRNRRLMEQLTILYSSKVQKVLANYNTL